jgi:hypothetical protein
MYSYEPDHDVLEDYSAGLEALADQALQESTSAHEYFESAIRRNDSIASYLLRIRESFLNESVRARVAGLLPIGFFRELTGTKRITAFVVALELSQHESDSPRVLTLARLRMRPHSALSRSPNDK